jgi:hypothetical protein
MVGLLHLLWRNARWRRVFSCVLAYALALQGLSFAAGAGQAAGLASQGADHAIFAGFAICRHSAAATLPEAPKQIPPGDEHCAFCIYSPLYLNCIPPHAPHVMWVAMQGALSPLMARRLSALLINESARPRGPPTAA